MKVATPALSNTIYVFLKTKSEISKPEIDCVSKTFFFFCDTGA
jgi:hypothetical protein